MGCSTNTYRCDGNMSMLSVILSMQCILDIPLQILKISTYKIGFLRHYQCYRSHSLPLEGIQCNCTLLYKVSIFYSLYHYVYSHFNAVHTFYLFSKYLINKPSLINTLLSLQNLLCCPLLIIFTTSPQQMLKYCFMQTELIYCFRAFFV